MCMYMVYVHVHVHGAVHVHGVCTCIIIVLFVVPYYPGYECEEHDNPADFFLDVVTRCEKQLVDTSGSIKY